MFTLEEPKSRKRRQPSVEPADTEPSGTAKRHKSHSEDIILPGQRPPGFWDTLSKIRLSRSALREFDHRNIHETCQRDSVLVQDTKDLKDKRVKQRLKNFARQGGPDLTRIRGFACLPPLIETRISRSTSQGSKRSSDSSRHGHSTRTSKTTPYSGNFEQKLIDGGIYPNNRASKPQNLQEIQEYLTRPRPSLSPSRFDDGAFDEFGELCDNVSDESTAMTKIIAIIAGERDGHHRSAVDVSFNNLSALNKDLSAPKPDVYYGASPSDIDPRVRHNLGRYIIPSKTTTRPAVPNFFLEGKSSQGRADVAKRQACYDGAAGARAMHHLQNYRADKPVYDNHAYSYSSTYHAGTSTLQIYATHPTSPRAPGGQPEYHMTQLNAYAMTGNIDNLREGATAYRNARDLAESQRNSFIDQANETERHMATNTPSNTVTTSRASLSSLFEDESNTSTDERARDEVTPVRRPRHDPARTFKSSSSVLDRQTVNRPTSDQGSGRDASSGRKPYSRQGSSLPAGRNTRCSRLIRP